MAIAVGTAAPPVPFARTVFAAIAARPSEFDAPPEESVVMEPVRPLPAVTVVVATLPIVVRPAVWVKYERPPCVMPEVVAIAYGFRIVRFPMVAPVPRMVRSTAVGVEVATDATPELEVA